MSDANSLNLLMSGLSLALFPPGIGTTPGEYADGYVGGGTGTGDGSPMTGGRGTPGGAKGVNPRGRLLSGKVLNMNCGGMTGEFGTVSTSGSGGSVSRSIVDGRSTGGKMLCA
jgi:hypothetical protein